MSRIAMVVTGLNVGGAERQVIELVKELTTRTHELLVITMLDPSEWGLNQIGNAASVASLSMKRGRPDPAAIWALRRTLAVWSPDIVHSHMIHANLLARVALIGSGMPLVNTVHNIVEGGRVLDGVQRLTRTVPDWTSVVSGTAFQRQEQDGLIIGRRSSVIHNGVVMPSPDTVRTVEWDHRQSASFRWLAIGRLEPQKNYVSLLRAFPHVLDRYPGTSLTIAGSGAERSALEAELTKLSIESDVELLGHVDDVPDLIDQHHALVNSSKWEGLPVTMLEAASRSRPIVATDVGGTGEVVQHGRSGFLAKVDDTSIAHAMTRLMDLDTRQFTRFGAYGREHVGRHFDIKTIASSWESLYADLVAPGRI